MRDIGYAEDGMAERRSFAYFNNKPAVVLEVRRQTGTNTVRVVDAVQQATERPQQAATRRRGAHDCQGAGHLYQEISRSPLKNTSSSAALLASIIIWLFIRDWRTVLISSIAIPTSIITTFALMRALDYTLNSMTLLALTLAVGIVIDDAIIVLENIYRYIE